MRSGIGGIIPGSVCSVGEDNRQLWSHYADLARDEEATGAYTQWAALLGAGGGIGLAAGCAVGRFTFELARKCDLVIGFDYSRPFIAAARRLLYHLQELNRTARKQGAQLLISDPFFAG